MIGQARAFSEARQAFAQFCREFLALTQWPAGDAGTFDMTPGQLVRIEIGRIPGQEVQRELALGRGHVFMHRGFLMRRQAVAHQTHRFFRRRTICLK